MLPMAEMAMAGGLGLAGCPYADTGVEKWTPRTPLHSSTDNVNHAEITLRYCLRCIPVDDDTHYFKAKCLYALIPGYCKKLFR